MAKHGPRCICNSCAARRFWDAKQQNSHRGGFDDPLHGWLDGNPVTAAFGWGTKEGHTLLADGHVELATFKDHSNHNHYGPGDGPNYNVKDRFKYTGARRIKKT